MTSPSEETQSVFLNCPFDGGYTPIFRAVVFTVFDCGFAARCALEIEDSTEVRIEKIAKLIGECRYAIHDLSRTELDPKYKLPRFNMPLELGIFLGAKKFGDHAQKLKSALILDVKEYRYQKFISDIAGQDIKAHNGSPKRAISAVRDWLQAQSKRTTIPGDVHIKKRYAVFASQLPKMCHEVGLTEQKLRFPNLIHFVSKWLALNTWTPGKPS